MTPAILTRKTLASGRAERRTKALIPYEPGKASAGQLRANTETRTKKIGQRADASGSQQFCGFSRDSMADPPYCCAGMRSRNNQKHSVCQEIRQRQHAARNHKPLIPIRMGSPCLARENPSSL
jgi:hypothetical protein